MKDRIRQLMEAKHMNQQAFARFTKIGTASLSSIFTGRTRPTMNHVVAIMDAFPEVNPTWLIKGEGSMTIEGVADTPVEPLQPITSPEAAVEERNLFSENSFIEPAETGTVQESLSTRLKRTQSNHVGSEGMMTDNMAVQQQYPSAMNPRTRKQSAQVSSINIRPAGSRITEIRVFFDDQTWESFVPKK